MMEILGFITAYIQFTHPFPPSPTPPIFLRIKHPGCPSSPTHKLYLVLTPVVAGGQFSSKILPRQLRQNQAEEHAWAQLLQQPDSSIIKIMSVQTVLYCTLLYCAVLFCSVLYCTVLNCTVLYCTVLYCTVLYCTVLYCRYFNQFFCAYYVSLYYIVLLAR